MLEFAPLMSVVLTLLAASFGAFGGVSRLIRQWKEARQTVAVAPRPLPKLPPGNGPLVLIGFGALALVFGLVCLIYYWPLVRSNAGLGLLGMGLFLVMVAGMFSQVLTTIYQTGRPFSDVTASDLIYPLLLSPIVFYPVWGATTGGTASFFAFYAAFLNGYFWRSVVAAAKPSPPSGRPTGRRQSGPGPEAPVTLAPRVDRPQVIMAAGPADAPVERL
jgi:hypothetical protein